MYWWTSQTFTLNSLYYLVSKLQVNLIRMNIVFGQAASVMECFFFPGNNYYGTYYLSPTNLIQKDRVYNQIRLFNSAKIH